jgi:hypothetical protein
MATTFFHSHSGDAPFEFLLDMFLRAESLACFAGVADDEEISLADLAVEGEEEDVAPAAEDDTLSLSDIAEEEASLEDDAETE